MKGVIVSSLKNMIQDNHDRQTWKNILKRTNLPDNMLVKATDDIDDNTVIKIFQSTCNELKIPFNQLADIFGDYWVNTFASKLYMVYFIGKTSAKEFLLSMDEIHTRTTNKIENAHPPRFDYNWQNDNTLIMTYKSERGLINLLVGLIKGVGKYYKEELDVKKLDDTKVQIVFP